MKQAPVGLRLNGPEEHMTSTSGCVDWEFRVGVRPGHHGCGSILKVPPDMLLQQRILSSCYTLLNLHDAYQASDVILFGCLFYSEDSGKS